MSKPIEARETFQDLHQVALREFHLLSGNLKGKVLTIIDASMPDSSQKKSMKDLIHEAFTHHEGQRVTPTIDYFFNCIAKNLGSTERVDDLAPPLSRLEEYEAIQQEEKRIKDAIDSHYPESDYQVQEKN